MATRAQQAFQDENVRRLGRGKQEAKGAERAPLGDISNKRVLRTDGTKKQQQPQLLPRIQEPTKAPSNANEPIAMEVVAEDVVHREVVEVKEVMVEEEGDAALDGDMEQLTADDVDHAAQYLEHDQQLVMDPAFEYEEDIYQYLLAKETKYAVRPDYMETVQTDVTHVMRSILVDWFVDVAEEYTLSQRTLMLAVNYVDRFLQKSRVHRTKLQLVGAAALLIASKYQEKWPPTVDDFVYITEDTYTRDQVLQVESLILNTLEFNLGASIPCEFIRRLTAACNLDTQGVHLTSYFLERFMQEPAYLEFRPSLIAAASISFGLHALGKAPWSRMLRELTGYDAATVRGCVTTMYNCLQRGLQNKSLQAVYEKYATDAFSRASLLPVPPVDADATSS